MSSRGHNPSLEPTPFEVPNEVFFDSSIPDSYVQFWAGHKHIDPNTELGKLGIDILEEETEARKQLEAASDGQTGGDALLRLNAAQNVSAVFEEMYRAINLSQRLNPNQATYAELVDIAESEALESLITDSTFTDETQIVPLANFIFGIRELYIQEESSHFLTIPRELDS